MHSSPYPNLTVGAADQPNSPTANEWSCNIYTSRLRVVAAHGSTYTGLSFCTCDNGEECNKVTVLHDVRKACATGWIITAFAPHPKVPTQAHTCRNTNRGNINPLNPELNPICYLLALLGAHHFLHVSRIRVKLLTFRRLMSCIYGAPILDVSRSHTTTQHSR